MFDPIGDRHISEEYSFLENQALAMGEKNAVFPDVTPLLNAKVCEEFVQSLAPSALLNSPGRSLELGFLGLQSRYSVGHQPNGHPKFMAK